MLSRAQQILLKRAQREAGISDADYRDALQMIAGCNSSTAPAFTDRHLDKLLAYFEAIHWRAVDAGKLQPSCSRTAIFRRRGYWASKNTNYETSRDRFTGQNMEREIAGLEAQMQNIGFSKRYCTAIAEKVTQGRTDAHARHLYLAALERTLHAKRRASIAV
ncbi:MAG TPA: hypothetical protein VGY56_20600 [Verrucomicrobiae bacterium]|nr:hypothetical protein [Verrucomicrobiae bacterium]